MLTIQRQFSLPNCILILEGFSTENSSEPRPLLSTLTRFECHFGNEAQKIAGGRDLLNLLAQTVHLQAQSLLSGIKSKPQQMPEQAGLTLEADHGSQYALTIDSKLIEDSANNTGLNLQLSSVQLFDLVEAFDQLMADTQTLPDLALPLKPLSKKEAIAQNGAGQKFIPISLGVASLALVAGLSFIMPTPEITKPTLEEDTSESVIDTEASPAPGTPEPSTSDETPADAESSIAPSEEETPTSE